MKKRTIIILRIIFFTIFIGSSSYIIYNQYKIKMEENKLEELRQNIEENPIKVDIVEEDTKILKTQNNKNHEVEMQEEKQKTILPQYKEKHQENRDLIGWIKIDDMPIDYPVMKTIEDPNFYIHRDWDKNESKQGLPFIDARCTLESENIIIYGHRMKNGTMFGSLKLYQEKSFFEKHQIIKFDTIYQEAKYQIIAVLLAQVFYNEKPDENEFVFYKNNYIEMDSEEQFQEYIKQLKIYSLYETGVSAEYGDSLITLCTCNYHVEDGRLLVVAKKIQ